MSCCDTQSTSDSHSQSSFTWSNGQSTSTEKSTISSSSHNWSDQSYTAQIWTNSGNIGTGNGSTESSSYSWSQSSKYDTTNHSETTRTSTSGVGGSSWNGSYTFSTSEVATGKTDEQGRYDTHSAGNGIVDGVHYEGKGDGYSESTKQGTTFYSKIREGNWQASESGIQSDTLNQVLIGRGITYDKSDYDFYSYSKSWTDAGILTNYSDGLSGHYLKEEDYPTNQVINNTSAGLQPVFVGGVVYSQGSVNPASFSGGSGTTYTSFAFQSVPMDASSPASIPDAIFGLNEDQAPQTYWETLASWIASGIDTAMDTAVWIVDQISYGVSEVGGFVIRNFEAVLDGIQLTLDVAGFVPVFGAIPDIINSGIHLGRGNYLDASLSAGAAVPFAGDAAQAVAMVRKVASKGADFAASAARSVMKLFGKLDNVDEVADVTNAVKHAPDGVDSLMLGRTPR